MSLIKGERFLSCGLSYEGLTVLDRLVEYSSRDEADEAIRVLDGKEIRGTAVRVALDEVSWH
jgi:hypothetical protein